MSDVKLNDLYQEVILDHNKNPRNFGVLEKATSVVHGVNPLCGDHFDIFVNQTGGKLQEIKFHGDGCAISKASASMMTDAVRGKTDQEAKAMVGHFIHLLTDENVAAADREGVGRLKFFEGVKNFPIRVKCATLAWRALEEALKGSNTQISTE